MSRDPQKSFQKSLYNPDEFTLTFELVPSRGGKGTGQNRILTFTKEAAADGRLQAVSITENAGGHPALSPEVLGLEIRSYGLDVINHFSCKDKNRNQIESLLFAWDRAGFSNLLVLTGDYPQAGYKGYPKPVFDLDSVQTLNMISSLNKGCDENSRSGDKKQFHPTSFLKGVAVSPFKNLQSELSMQYLKLLRKVDAGADFIITQLGYDSRKFHEIIEFLRLNDLDLPILGNVFIPNLTVTKLMHQGEIPGCIIPDELYKQIILEAESPDRGKKARLLRAAKLLAILKGLGYSGAHIGGPGLLFEDLSFVMDNYEKMAADWQQYVTELSYWPKEGPFYFALDEHSGLNLSQARVVIGGRQRGSFNYQLSKKTHDLFFSPEGCFFESMKRLCFKLEKQGFEGGLDRFEYLIKILLFNCQNCGDCRLADLAYLCPYSGCAKFLLNGPCGGSQDGWCEVYPKKKLCFYVKLFDRLNSAELLELFTMPTSRPRDWSRNQTSSWLNFFHETEKQQK